MSQSAVRYLTIPDDIDLTGDELIKTPTGRYSFRDLFGDIVPFLPCTTGDQADTLDALAEKLLRCTPGTTVELREADHAALSAAAQQWRQRIPGPAQLTLMPLLAAIARATTKPPKPVAVAAE